MSANFNQPLFTQPLDCFGLCNGDVWETSSNHQRPFQGGQRHAVITSEDQKQKQELDTLLSQAMNGLTFEERQQQQEVLHGVDQVIVEDENLLNSALQDLDLHLSHIKQGSFYEMAEGMDPGYVHAKPFRVMFLRANKYDPEASADQMVRFFEMKHQLFGENKLTKDITMEDLDEDDIACLKTGWLQMAGRDRSGRQIFIHIGGLLGNTPTKTIQNDLRILFFIMMRALKSEETQIRGTVSIWYAMGDCKSKTNGKGYFENFMAARALPQKKAAIHVCVDEVRQSLLCKALIMIMKDTMRARLRVHIGSELECQYQLSSYGILPQSLPLDANGRMNFDRHLRWVRDCSMKDKMLSHVPSSSSILSGGELESNTAGIKLSQNDVLFSRGKFNNQAGNQRFRALIVDFLEAYISGTDEEKRQIVTTIIENIHVSGGRFLSLQSTKDTTWKEVPPSELRKKIMQTFRNRRRLDDGSNKPTGPMSGTLITGVPLPFDVVFGRSSQRHPGIDKLHRLMKDKFEEYESLDRGLKMRLVEEIMQCIKDQGGRFLEPAPEPGQWFEVSHDKARERISKYFRNHRRYWTKKEK